MTEIVISINPEWIEKIFQLRKTWELRTTKPMCPTPFRCFIYKTGNGGVVGEFTCDLIEYERSDKLTKDWLKDTRFNAQYKVVVLIIVVALAIAFLIRAI